MHHVKKKKGKVSTLHTNWQNDNPVDCDKLCIYNLMPRATNRIAIKRDMLKNIIN